MALASAPLSGFVGLDLPDFGSFKAAAAEEYQSGSYYYTVTDGKATLSGSLGNISGDIVVPSTIDGYPVVALEGTFSGRNVVNVTVPEGVTTIGAYSFSRSEKLKSVTLPDGVTSIGYGAFQICTGLESVRIGEGLVSLDYGAFAVCNSLKEITLPDTVTSIGEYSFIQCYALKTITLPDGITVIPVSAFNECTSLTSIVIPENVTTIDDRAFDDCSALTDVYFKGSKEQWNAISIGDDNDALTNVTVHYHYGKDHDYSIDVVITPPCTSDGVGAKRCSLCGELSETFAIPQTGHFPGEWELKTAATCVEDGEEVKICSQCSEEVESRAISATGHEPGEWEIQIEPTSVKDGKKVKYCTKCGSGTTVLLDSLTYPESEHNYGNNMDQTYHFSYPYAQQYTLTFSSKTAFENKWDSLYIYDGSGAQVGKYTGTELASQVITVTGDSFSLRLTSDSSTTKYGFSFDSIEATVKQPLEEMVIPATGIALPIEYVEWTVANGSATITGYKEGLSGDLVIPAKLDDCPVVQIANDAFNSCESLESVTLPDSMTTIEAGAFKSCTSLKSITIPDSVVIIESNAFYGCPALTDVYYTGTKAQWNAILIQSGNGHLANEATHYYHHGHPHDYSIDVVITPPCTSDGVGTKRCSLCDELGEYYTIPQTGHVPGEWEIKTAPTCVEDGEEVKICSQCSEELESRAVSATGHKPGEWEVKTAVTCVKDGEEVKICSQCSEEVESRAIIATGHELGEWEIVTERTATTDGKTIRYCNKCAPKNAYVLLDKSTYPESEHNYPNYADKTYNFSYPGALELKLTFSSKCEFEGYYDYLYIYDGSGAKIGQYSSINLASRVITIPGDSFSLRLDSDSSGTRYGFSLDRLEAKLDQPIEEIVEPAYGFEAANNSQVDFDNNIISGISAGMTSLDGFTQILLDDYSWTYEPGAHGLGTGSKAIMKKGDEVVGEYTLLLYGDVDGDGWYNANDAFLVNMLTAGLITEEAISTLAYTAADANHDGTVNEFDFELISSASLLLDDIDQTATGEELATQSMFITYMSLIDQTPEVEEEPEAPQSPDVNDTTVTPEAQTEFASFIETIFSYILSILQKIFKIF